MVKNIWIVVLALLAAMPAYAGGKKYDIPCQKVFITGTQTHEIAWALNGEGTDNNLYKHTCLEPVSKPEDAQAVLDIEMDPKIAGALDARLAARERAVQDGTYSVTCSSGARGASCSDSAGNISVVSCSSRGCSSYVGPNPLIVATNLIGDALVHWAEVSAGWGYLWNAKTHELIWKYEGDGQWHADLTKYSECKKRSKWGTAPENMCVPPNSLLP